MTGKAWTAADDETLTAMRAAGDSARAIGERLGRTRESILGRAMRLGLSKPTPSSITRAANQPARQPPVIIERSAFDGVGPGASIEVLGRRSCRFPMWPDGERPGRAGEYCAARAVDGTSWCQEHLRVVAQPLSATRKPRALYR